MKFFLRILRNALRCRAERQEKELIKLEARRPHDMMVCVGICLKISLSVVAAASGFPSSCVTRPVQFGFHLGGQRKQAARPLSQTEIEAVHLRYSKLLLGVEFRL